MAVTKRDQAALALAHDVYTAIVSTELDDDVLQALGEAVSEGKRFEKLPREVKIAMLAMAYKLLPGGENDGSESSENTPTKDGRRSGNRSGGNSPGREHDDNATGRDKVGDVGGTVVREGASRGASTDTRDTRADINVAPVAKSNATELAESNATTDPAESDDGT